LTDHLRPHDVALKRLRALHPQKIDLSLHRMEHLCEIGAGYNPKRVFLKQMLTDFEFLQ